MPPEAAAGQPESLTEAQAAVYDRQLRLWGHAVQQRLTGAKLLVIGGDGLAAEIAKNLVLAGVGHVALADDTPVSKASFGNFLVHADATYPTTVAQASAHTLAAMNPLISVTTVALGVPATPGQALTLQPEQLAPYDLIISTCGLASCSSDSLEALCAEAGKQLYVAEVSGSTAYAFVNLGPSHAHAKSAETVTKERTLSYPRLTQALAKPVGKCLGRIKVHSLYQVLRAARRFEAAHGRPPWGSADLEGLKAAAAELEASEGAAAGAVSADMLEEWVVGRDASQHHLGSAPAAAVAGGAIANSVVRTISRVGAPIFNWFFFSLHDGFGTVEELVA